jgi:predicted GNAT family N-acyltransferase
MSDVAAATRQFPAISRVDLEGAIRHLLAGKNDVKLMALHAQMESRNDYRRASIGFGAISDPCRPMQHDEARQHGIEAGSHRPGGRRQRAQENI